MSFLFSVDSVCAQHGGDKKIAGKDGVIQAKSMEDTHQVLQAKPGNNKSKIREEMPPFFFRNLHR